MNIKAYRTLTIPQERAVVDAYTNTDEQVRSIAARFGLRGTSAVSAIVKRWGYPLRPTNSHKRRNAK